VALARNGRYPVTLEYYDNTGNGVARFLWQTPGGSSFVVVPIKRLYAD
jgi:hypothetical protein